MIKPNNEPTHTDKHKPVGASPWLPNLDNQWTLDTTTNSAAYLTANGQTITLGKNTGHGLTIMVIDTAQLEDIYFYGDDFISWVEGTLNDDELADCYATELPQWLDYPLTRTELEQLYDLTPKILAQATALRALNGDTDD